MPDINSSDIMIILKGAVQMAQEDTDLDPKEEEFLNKIIEAGNLDPETFGDFNTKVKQEIDIVALSEMLSSNRAQKAFLLGLATMALADGVVDEHETEFLANLCREMGVGGFKISALSYEKGESMLLGMIRSVVGS